MRQITGRSPDYYPRAKALGRRLGIALVASTAIFAAGGAFAPVLAQEAVADYAVPAGPLGRAITRFGETSGLQILYPADLVRGKDSPGVTGPLNREAALFQLLAGSGLTFRYTAANTVTLTPDGSAAAPSNPEVLGTITLNGTLGSRDDMFQSAGSVGYIDAAEVAQNRGTSVGDFLSGVPGVLNGDNRNSGALDVNIRGMQGQGRVPVVIDGASQEQTVYRGYNGARSASYVDPDFIGEVAIEKGASNRADATGAIGGIVRMSTLSVNDILLPGRKFGIRLRGGFNTNSTSIPDVLTPGGVAGGAFQPGYPTIVRDGGNLDRPGLFEPTGGNGSVALAFTTDNFDLVAAVAKRRNGNYFSGEHGPGQAHLVDMGLNGADWQVIGYEGLSPWKGGEEILNTSTDNTSTLLKGTFRLSPDQTLELGYSRYDSSFGEIMPTRLGSHTSAVGGFQSDLDSVDLKTFTARYRWDPASDLINLKLDLFRTDMDHRATNLLTMMGITTASYSWQQSIRTGMTLSNESRIAAMPGDFSLTYGGAWQRETTGLPKDLADREYVIDHLEFAPRSGARVETSAFLNADWQITPEWQVTGGLRYSDYKTTDQHMWLQSLGYWPNYDYVLHSGVETERGSHGLSKNIAVSWTPRPDLQLYARYSDAMRMPTLFETLSGFSVGYLPEDIRPERAKAFEIGANTAFENLAAQGDRLRLHLAYYDNDIDDYLTRSNVTYPHEIGFQLGGLGMINLENARMRGLELAADYERGDFSARLSWNHAITSRYCARPGSLYRQNDLCTEGGFINSYALQHVPPKDTVTLQMGYRMFEDRLALGTRISHYANRFVETTVSSTSEIQPGRWKPYTLVDIFATYRIDEAKEVSFAIDNLTDRYYMDALNAARMPAPGRTLRVNFTTKF